MQVGNFDQLVLGAQTTDSNKTGCKMKLRFRSFTHTQCGNQCLKSVSGNLESLQNFDQNWGPNGNSEFENLNETPEKVTKMNDNGVALANKVSF